MGLEGKAGYIEEPFNMAGGAGRIHTCESLARCHSGCRRTVPIVRPQHHSSASYNTHKSDRYCSTSSIRILPEL